MRGLIGLLEGALAWFAALTDRPELAVDERLLCVLLLALGAVLCLFGIRAYRGCFAVLCYAGVVILWCLTLKGRLDWGTLATGFSVTGCVLGFLAYRWETLGTVLMPALLAFAGARALLPELWQAVCIAAVVFLIAYGVPLYSVCLSTALFGAFLVWEAGTWLWLRDAIPAAAALLLGFAAAAAQLWMAKRHKPQIPVLRSWAERLRYSAAEKMQKEADGGSSI